MRQLAVICIVFCSLQRVVCQAQTATWKFPLSGQVIQANANDAVLLDWTSTFTPETILRMWCLNGTDGATQDLASSFDVNVDGPFSYVLDEIAPGETSFPLICHAELANSPLGSGVDSPAGITWHSNPAAAAKTISQTQTASSSSPTTSSTSSSSSSSSSASSTSSLSATSASSKSQVATSSPSVTQSTSSSGSSTSPTTTPPPSTGGSSNVGAIVGGVIGGLALISFIIIALLFLRRHNRRNEAAANANQGFYLHNVHKKGGLKARVAGLFEKEGDHGAHEKDGISPSEYRTSELHGSTTPQKDPSKAEGVVHGGGNNGMHNEAFELPGHP